MKKRLLSILLCSVLCLSCLAGAASAASANPNAYTLELAQTSGTTYDVFITQTAGSDGIGFMQVGPAQQRPAADHRHKQHRQRAERSKQHRRCDCAAPAESGRPADIGAKCKNKDRDPHAEFKRRAALRRPGRHLQRRLSGRGRPDGYDFSLHCPSRFCRGCRRGR
jgi:hypothetical protein